MIQNRLEAGEIKLEKMVEISNKGGVDKYRDSTAKVFLRYITPTSHLPDGGITNGLSSNVEKGGIGYMAGVSRVTEAGKDQISLELGSIKNSKDETNCMVVNFYKPPVEEIRIHLSKPGNVLLMVGTEKVDMHKLSAFVNEDNGIIEHYRTFEQNKR